MKPHIVVVGLGPAGADMVLPAARAALERIPIRFARTERHRAYAELVADGLAMTSFDERYQAGSDLDEVYTSIVDALLAAARTHSEIAYAVPGSPAVAEHTVVRLHEWAPSAGVDVDVVPGLSFADLAWARLGIDSFRGAHVVDARDLGTSAAGLAGPLLIAQCDSRMVLSEVKLVLLEGLPPETPVKVLARLGLPDEAVTSVALADLDRDVTPDHLTSLFVDTGTIAVAGEFAALVALAERLRGPGGCPWDAEQTHHSLVRHLLEEAYEVADAIEGLPVDAPVGEQPVAAGAYDALEDELGDLLFQVVIHSVLAREAGAFTIADVARGIHTKLVRRHPHVFGSVTVEGSDDVVRNWEQIKRGEKATGSLVSGIASNLPALLLVPKLFRKADSIGLDAGHGALERARAALESDATPDSQLVELLAAVVAMAWERGVDAESALREWARHYRDRFAAMEESAQAQGIDLDHAPAATVATLWAATET
ncbi:MAG: tetrapyrrole methylase family protein / MazG family protein [Actinomycetota bacterium]|nr:tetrapyrrole methylase family protein / MazG family protein [Actinomycetota bacterium]